MSEIKLIIMIKRNRVNSKKDTLFEFCWNLYEESFPIEEKRPNDYQLEALEKEAFHFDAILDDKTHIGFIGWWELENFRYVEHFAISSTERGGGYGAKVLNDFINQDSKTVVLEVEHPTSEINRRRIGFYERLGFHLNQYNYSHPSYHSKDGEPVDLLIMSYPNAIDREQLDNFVKEGFPIIHFRYY